MNSMNKYFKYLILFMILLVTISIVRKNNILSIGDILQANLYQGLRVVKISEEKANIEDENISITVKMPQIHYNNEEVQRYINTYIRKNINSYINHQRQLSDIGNKNDKTNISVNYHIPFENSEIINIVIYKNISKTISGYYLEKESYVFDLRTGQRIYIDNFLKNNEDYIETIENYINSDIVKNNLEVDREIIKINKYTNYIIVDGGINVYFNPYKKHTEGSAYEFKIPYTIFKNKIKMVDTNNIVANVDTQTITKNNDYINSVINIPIITTSNKKFDKSINDKIRSDIMNFYIEGEKDAKNYFKDYPDTQNKFVINVDFNVKKNSDNMLSIITEYYRYSGGAHGNYENIPYNIDMNTGLNLGLSDLFEKSSNYKAIIDKEIRKQIEEMVKKDKEYEGIYEFKGIKDNQKFYIQDENVVVYFDLYEIAPYAAGIPEFSINSKLLSHIIKDEYIDVFK